MLKLSSLPSSRNCCRTDNQAFLGLFHGFRPEAYLKIAMIGD
jgi:hypothetical protein